MSDDELIGRLAQAARERAERQARWDRYDALVSGDLSAEQEALLRREAEADPEEAQALEVFRPLDADFRRRLATRLQRLQGQRPSAEDAAPAVAEIRLEKARRRRRWLVAAPVALAVAAAAVILLVLLPSDHTWPPVPDYSLSLRAGDVQLRGDRPSTAAPPRLSPGSTFLLELRPEQRLQGPVAARFYLQKGHGELEPLSTLPLEIDAHTGAMRVEGELGRQVKLPDGELTLWIAVGRPDALSEPSPGSRPGRQASGWHLLRVKLRVGR